MSKLFGAQRTRGVPVNQKVATALVTLAGALALVALSGWPIDSPALKGFGFSYFPIRPLSALGVIALAAGFVLAIRGRKRAALLCWALPIAIAVGTVVELVTGVSLEIGRWIFPRQFDEPWAAAGRPKINPTMVFTLLPAAGLVALQESRQRRQWAGLLAAIAFTLGAVAAVLILFSSPGDLFAQWFASSLPASLATMLLAAGVIAWQVDFRPLQLLQVNRSQWRTVRALLPLAIILPAAPSLLELSIATGGISPLAREMLVMLGNVLIVTALLYWALSTLAYQQAELVELSHALDSANVALTTLEGTITHWSAGCEELYGWRAAEAIGKRKYELLKSRCASAGLPGLPTPGGPDGQELIEVRRDGSEISVIEGSQPVQSPGREPVLVLKMLDISGRVRAQAALFESEARLALATEAHEVGVFEWDVASGKLHWSPGAEQRLGLKPGQMSDFESWRAAVHPDDVQAVLDTIARTVAERDDKFSFRYRFHKTTSGTRSIEGSARCFYDSVGNLVRTVGVMLETTARDQRERSLLAREAQLRSVLETVPDAMVVIDEHGTMLEFSAAAERLWGYRAADVLGKNFTMLASAETRAGYTQALERFLATGEAPFIGRVLTGTGESADGRRFPLEIRTGMARSDASVLFTIFFRDVTDAQTNEARFADLNAELAHVSRQSAMSELAADLAHELNQPLAAVTNFLSAARILIERGDDPGRVAELLQMGSEQALRAGEIIRRLREFMSKGEVDMRAEPLDRMVRDAVELVMVGTSRLDIRLSYEFDPAARTVFADRVQVQQVLVNLLRNALEALRLNPRDNRNVWIRSRLLADEEMVEIEVADSGPGLPEAVLKQLYTRFSSTKGNAGMGIGLSICRRIIEAHGGTLEASNRPEGGASFRFTLPAVEELEDA